MSRKRRSRKSKNRKQRVKTQLSETRLSESIEKGKKSKGVRDLDAGKARSSTDATTTSTSSIPSSSPLGQQFTNANSTIQSSGDKRPWARLSVGFLAAIGIVLIPFVYWWMTSLPAVTTVAGGVESGQYQTVADSLREHLRKRITRAHNIVGFKANADRSRGSLDNLRKLQCGEIDFGLYQVGTLDELREEEFDELDTGGNNDGTSDGALDKSEFREHFDVALGEDEIDSRTANAFRKLDSNRNGKLSKAEFNEVSNVRFVSNLYDDILHVITLKDNPIGSLRELRGKRVGFGFKYSGNYAASRMLFRSIGLTVNESSEETNPQGITPFPSDEDWANRTDDEMGIDVYELMRRRLKNGHIAAAIFIVGPDAKILNKLFEDEDLRLLDLATQLPAIQHECMEFSEHTVTKSLYRKFQPQISFSNNSSELKTVSLRVQLLSHDEVDSNLVKLVTGIVMDDQFQKENRLRQLYTGSVVEREKFARNRPGFKIHYGALVYYDGGFNPGEFAGWQAFYSLFASIGLAVAVSCRWIWRKRRRQREHRLNQYFNRLFVIEEKQLDFDRQAGADDLLALQDCLDEITRLRQRAMQDFNAHELNDDAAFQAFLQACHYISQKVNAKLSRQRSRHLSEQIVESLSGLAQAIREKDSSSTRMP